MWWQNMPLISGAMDKDLIFKHGGEGLKFSHLHPKLVARWVNFLN
jgi:hypothetical protein